MQQRQLRLGDILDDYCPRERRLTNHAVVAMVGPDVKQTRCTTCDTEHEFKHGKVPRQRRKGDSPAALYTQVLASARKRVPSDATSHLPEVSEPDDQVVEDDAVAEDTGRETASLAPAAGSLASPLELAADDDIDEEAEEEDLEEGPVHRPLIRATLPRQEGQPPASRPAPDFTIRQPAGRAGRFRPRHQGGQSFQGDRGNGNSPGPMRSGLPRQGGRPPVPARMARRQNGGGRKRSK